MAASTSVATGIQWIMVFLLSLDPRGAGALSVDVR